MFKKLAKTPSSLAICELESVFSCDAIKPIPLVNWMLPTLRGFQKCLCALLVYRTFHRLQVCNLFFCNDEPTEAQRIRTLPGFSKIERKFRGDLPSDNPLVQRFLSNPETISYEELRYLVSFDFLMISGIVRSVILGLYHRIKS
jgi:hypothetical protein